MWTLTTRAHHGRAGQRHESDLTDAGWAILSPFLPPEAGCGRKRGYRMREVVNATCSALRSGTWETINHHRVMRDRERVGRQASPTATVKEVRARR